MKATEILSKIKTYLGEDTADIVENVEQDQEVKVELAQAKLENGTVLEAEAFESGKEIFILTDDEKVAVPVGEYQMEDGQILVVQEEGLIAEIKKAEAKEEEEVEASEEQVEEQLEEEEVEAKYATKEELAEVKSLVEEIKAMIDKKEEMSEVEEQVKEELSETPAAEAITHNPEPQQKVNLKFAKNRKTSTLDKVMSKIVNS
jgi:crotonobetainyl-CoA:carnitine CoA-transferase CaiB-like acyl-CoA transferase